MLWTSIVVGWESLVYVKLYTEYQIADMYICLFEKYNSETSHASAE